MYRHASCVNVSLYSMGANVHDSITTVEGSFEKTKANILQLLDNNVPVQINCPIMKQNQRHQLARRAAVQLAVNVRLVEGMFNLGMHCISSLPFDMQASL